MPTNFDAIPLELRELKQFILWRYEDKGGKKPTKVPYSIAHTLASVNEPKDWSSFNDVKAVFQFGGYDGIGFVFTNTEYSGIDLDDCSMLLDGSANPNRVVDLERQIKIYNELDSYSERSPSGNGLHIIVKGNVPSGKKKSFIEIYSTGRYFTMTGNVYNDKPICYKQDLLMQLWKQMGGENKPVFSYANDEPQTQSDEEIIKIATDADNGYKFNKLYNGEWQEFYPHIAAAGQGSSEACLAIIDIISFYTQNKEQIERIFMHSKLGNVEKYKKRRDLVLKMIERSFDRAPLKVDFENYTANINEQLALPLVGSVNGKPAAFDAVNVGSSPAPTANYNGHAVELGSIAQLVEPSAHNGLVAGSNPAASTTIPIPPGIMGEIAQFVYEASPRPVPEIAIAAAISFMAGICGRAYNISGTGLNHYVLLLADTGSGKEAAKSGIDKLLSAVSMSVPVAREFMGPSQIASGQALYKALFRNPCFVSVIGEFGLRMQAMSAKFATSSEIKLKELMLDVYGKSGFQQVLEASVYSDIEKNTTSIHAPNFSLFGESVPSEFYDHLDEDAIKGGLLPRFIIIEYDGGRVARNVGHDIVQPSITLVNNLASLMANAKTIMSHRKVVNIDIRHDARKIADEFDVYADNRINSSNADQTKQLWNRAHLKLLKLSALVAVGCNFSQPTIEVDHVLWAKQIIENDIKKLSKKLDSGLIGKNTEETQQINDAKRIIKFYLIDDWNKIKTYTDNQQLHSTKIIPHSYLSKRLYNVASFKKDRLGAGNALRKTIQLLIDNGVLNEVSKKQIEKYGTTAKCYWISNVNLLEFD